MKPYLPKNAEDASALVITLLVVLLLSTIAVSFLSTARLEQTATRNYSAKTMAEQFAISATEQAVAKIEQGFNATGNGTGNFTSILTTQPGAIKKYFFSNGTLQTNSTITTELFSSGSGNLTNLNNLQNPGNSTSSATSNQWTITGNASERINVFMENVTTSVNGANQTVGRIAYYVDDEGAKLNLNAATGDRPTLNVGSARSLSLSTLTNSTQSANFTAVVNGNASSNSTSDIKNWAHFFRPEQVAGLFGGDAAISGNLSKVSAAPIVGSDYHLKKTPWGTDRLFINDLPIDSTGVNAIYEALSGKNATTGNLTADQGLRNIYGTTFAEKYTDAGLKQIAANILQARDPNVLNDPAKSFTYNGSLLGATNATTDLVAIADCCDTANATKVIPKDYLGNAPFPILNEIGVTVTWGYNSPNSAGPQVLIRLYVRPFISILNPWPVAFPKEDVANWTIEMQVDSFRYTLIYQDGSNKTSKNIYGPQGYKNLEDSWGHTGAEASSNRSNRGSSPGQLPEQWPMGGGLLNYSLNGSSIVSSASSGSKDTLTLPSYAEELGPGKELQFPCPPFHNDYKEWTAGFQLIVSDREVKITDIKDIEIKFEYIRLLAVSNNSTAIRDWVLAEDLIVKGWLQKPHPTVPAWTEGFPKDIKKKEWDTLVPPRFISRENTKPPQYSIKRIGGALKTSANMRVSSSRNSTQAWSESGNATWVSANASGGVLGNYTADATKDAATFPSKTKDNEIPGDPTMTDSDLRYAFDPREHHLDTRDWPKIEFTNPANSTGVFTSPADLGKIQTNIQHRKLRFTTQHPKEVSVGNGGLGNATYIPDWAMLDVISFGSNVTTVPLPAPLNLNGRFHVPSGSPQPAPRTAGLESALKALDSASSLGNSFNANLTVSTNRSQYMGSSGNVSSTVAGNIGNLTWSTGNFTTGNSTWGRGNSTNDPGSRRKTKNLPVSHIVLPSEVTEIRGVSDVVPLDNYTGNSTHIKANEGRLSSLFPGATTQSRFFTIYAYAQALDRQGQPDSEAVTKTLVEVEEQTPVTTPPTYKVKKLYTQPISVQ